VGEKNSPPFQNKKGGSMMHTSVIDFDTCGQLIHASQDRLYRLAYCYVKNEHDALDIVGEATYKALVSLHTLQRADRFDA